VAIIHTDNTYDLTNDPEWKAPHQYVDTENIYSGEIGKIAGCRFVESTEAKIFHAANLTEVARELTVRTAISAATPTVAVKEAITAAEALSLVGRKVMLAAAQYEIVSATAGAENTASIQFSRDVSAAAVDAKVCPGEAGAGGRDVYSTLILGANAYGETEIASGGLEHIVKQLGSAGTSDPLNQRATAGWKASKSSKRLVEEYMIRVESCSTFQSGAN
ncbi:MAG: N4-gp56 family major capsid protein, partial [Evtepia sp.]